MSDTKSLAEISKLSDDDIVRIYLADRGLVAVERHLGERLASPEIGAAFYDPRLDRYLDKKRWRYNHGGKATDDQGEWGKLQADLNDSSPLVAAVRAEQHGRVS